MKTVKRYLLCEVRPGMVLAAPVIAPGKKTILLTEETTLDRKMIDYLASVGCQAVDIAEFASSEDVAYQEDVRRFRNTYSLMIDSLQKTFDGVRSARTIPVPRLMELTEQSLEFVGYSDIMKLLKTIHHNNERILQHSLNVALVAGALSRWLGCSKQQTTEAIMAGMLHDIGKALIPESILNKPGKLLPYEMNVVRCHSFYSFQLIQPVESISDTVKTAVLQHHERLDGSGYPDRLAGGAISPLAQIIAIADMYDAMTSHLVYRLALSSLQAVEQFHEDMFGKLNPVACLTITRRLKDLMIGCSVLLDNGLTAKILHFQGDDSFRPLVKLHDGQYLDMEKNSEVQIVKVFDF